MQRCHIAPLDTVVRSVKCFLSKTDEVLRMNDTDLNIPNGPGMTAMMWDKHASDVVLSYRIAANSSRVLYALSIPEYIEAWLQPADAEESRFVFNLEPEGGFRLDLYRAEALQTSVHGSCLAVGANHVRYTWNATSPVGTTKTLVDMRLLRSSGGCILSLKHSGFKNAGDSAWCCKMWHQSLERLCRLMEKNRAKDLHWQTR